MPNSNQTIASTPGHIRIVMKDGSIHEIAPETLRRIELDVSEGATVWVETPTRDHRLGDRLIVPVLVMGRPLTVPAILNDGAINSWKVTALPRPTAEEK